MAILDGLGEVFGNVFGSIFPDGVLRKITLVDNGKGGYSSTLQDHPVKVLVETCNDEMRAENDYVDTDVQLIILRYGVPVDDLVIDDKVQDKDLLWYNIKAPISRDPVEAAWIVRGSLIKGVV